MKNKQDLSEPEFWWFYRLSILSFVKCECCLPVVDSMNEYYRKPGSNPVSYNSKQIIKRIFELLLSELHCKQINWLSGLDGRTEINKVIREKSGIRIEIRNEIFTGVTILSCLQPYVNYQLKGGCYDE